MELNIVEKSKNRVVVEMTDGDISLYNVIRKELWNDKDVKIAGCNIDHPLVGKPRLIVETKGTAKPLEAIKSAVDRLKKEVTKAAKDAEKT